MARSTWHRKAVWTYICPIRNLRLSKEIGQELRIENVTFVSKARLPRIRKRLGILQPISQLAKPAQDFFRTDYETYAVLQAKGKPRQIENKLRQQIRDACFILSVGSWPYKKRSKSRYLSAFGLPDMAPKIFEQSCFTGPLAQFCGSYRWMQGIMPFTLDSEWKKFQREARVLYNLLETIGPNSPISEQWKTEVRRAAVLLGRSLQTPDRSIAFTLNTIALDVLLLKRGEKADPNLYNRLEAILGWSNVGRTQPWFNKGQVTRLRKLRNELFHEGKDRITSKDLVLSDKITINLLINICRMRGRWRSKKNLIHFAKQVEARRFLGIAPYKGLLPPFKVMLPCYLPQELNEI